MLLGLFSKDTFYLLFTEPVVLKFWFYFLLSVAIPMDPTMISFPLGLKKNLPNHTVKPLYYYLNILSSFQSLQEGRISVPSERQFYLREDFHVADNGNRRYPQIYIFLFTPFLVIFPVIDVARLPFLKPRWNVSVENEKS